MPLLLALAAAPPLLILLDIHRYSVNLPYGDEWSWVELIYKFKNGELTVHEVFKWSGEFRPALPRATVLLLYRLVGRWDVTLELYFNALCAGAGALAWWRILRDGLPQPPSRALSALGLAGLSALVFSTAHSLDWVMGYQMVWLLAFALFSLTMWALISLRRRRLGLAVAVVTAVGGSYCIASGLLAWPLGLATVWLQSRAGRRPPRHALVWLIAAVACVALYATEYRPNPAATRPEESLGQPLQMLHFVLNYLGAPLGVGLGATAATLFGVAGLILLVGVTMVVLADRAAGEMPLERLERRALPWLILAGYTVVQGGLIAFGRLRFGVDYPLIASHYVLFGSMLWAALIGLAITAAPSWAGRARAWGAPKQVMAVIAAAALLAPAAVGYVTAYRKGRADFQGFNNRLAIAQAHVLYDVASVPDRVIRAIHWDSEVGRQRLMMLYEMREALFATQRVQVATFAQLRAERDRDAALAVLSHSGYARRPIAASAVQSAACAAGGSVAGAFRCAPAAGDAVIAAVDLPPVGAAASAYLLVGSEAATSLDVAWMVRDTPDAQPAGEPFAPLRAATGRDAFVLQIPISATRAVLTLNYAPAIPSDGDAITLDVFQ